MAQRVESGPFEFDENDNLYGPGDYFRVRGEKLYDAILAGDDAAYNTVLMAGCPNPRKAILDRLALDYASWNASGVILGGQDA